MPRARKTLVSLDATPYYHCTTRCVRRAFLCGKDLSTGQSFEHRRQWIEDRLIKLADIFAIDLCAYAVMSNHYHAVLHVDKARALSWSDQEVIDHWTRLFKSNVLISRFSQGEPMGIAEREAVRAVVETWRERLYDIGWFMRCINEYIARQANKEDQVTGRFWEGRFSSQALLDEPALAGCMVYVDLNPIRAQMAETLEDSDHTSIKQRFAKACTTLQPNDPRQQPIGLFQFVGNPRQDIPKGLPFKLTDYLELVDWTGRIIREDKRGYITAETPTIINQLNIHPSHWKYLATHFESPFKHLVGSAHRVRQACAQLGQRWTHGIRQCEKLFSSG